MSSTKPPPLAAAERTADDAREAVHSFPGPLPPPHPLAGDFPLFGLSLHTPRLALRPVWDEDLADLADAAAAGIHPQNEMPFTVPWSRDERPGLLRGTANTVWSERATRTPAAWTLSFAVRRVAERHADWWEAPIVGRQDLRAVDFNLTRSIGSGSWLTASVQGNGLGAEMRHAVVQFALDYLGATECTSGAYAWNAKSLGTSRSVGYVANGERRVVVDGAAQTELLVRLDRSTYRHPGWEVEARGDIEGIRRELGVTSFAAGS